jgi:hypothetical protein
MSIVVPLVSDDEIHESLQGNQLRLMDERGGNARRVYLRLDARLTAAGR